MRPPPQTTQVEAPYRSIGQLCKEGELHTADSSSLQLLSLASPPPDEGSSKPQTPDDVSLAQTFLRQRFNPDNSDPFATKPPRPITSSLPQQNNKNTLNPQQFAGGGGSGGKSTPNAGLGGGGPTGGGGGPGLVNANMFIGDSFGASNDSPASNVPPSTPPAHAGAPGGGQTPSPPLTDFQTSYAMTPPARPALTPHGHNPSGGGDPLYVLDMNSGETVPANSTLNTFSTWSENLEAQVSGASMTNYSWNLSQAPDFTATSGTTSYNLQGSWNSFTGPARTDIISVTETPQPSGSPLTQTMTFVVAGTDSPAYSASRPTSASTWANVITPDQVTSGQATQAAGSFASVGLTDGSAQTSFSMPSYNPNVAPVALDYNSTAANPQPIFLVRYQLPPGQSVPQSISAQMTFNNGTPAAPVYFQTGPGDYVAGDWLQMALQVNATGLSSGRYPWSITVTNGSTQTTYNGYVNIVNQASSPYGAGWAVDGVEQLVSVSGGVLIVNPDGTSLFFAGSGGSYTSPPGDFSTLTAGGGGYTRTLTDGTQINFNGSGQQTSVVDRDGNTTSYGYTNGLLTSITDMNGQVTTLSYTNGQLTGITDPANRSVTLGYTGSQLTSIKDPATNPWYYHYDSANDLTSLTDANNNTTGFTYNFADRVSSIQRPDNTSASLTAEQMNGLATPGTGGNPSSNLAQATLVATGDAAQYTDGNTNEWTTGLDWLGMGLDVQDLDALGDASMSYVDANGLPWMTTDGVGDRTRQFFDNKGNVTQIVYPDDTTEKYTYNSFSEVTSYTDPTGYTTTYGYNTKGDLTSITDALTHATTFGYNSQGFLTSITDALNNLTQFAYNSLNELTSIVNAANQTTTFSYDNYGNLSGSTDARGFVSSFVYNVLNQMTSETLPNSSSSSSTDGFTYDKVGNMLTSTDALNNVVTYTYTPLNQVGTIYDPTTGYTTYTYDNEGNQTGLTNPLNQTTNYGYDAANRLTSVTNPLTQKVQYGYNAAGQVISTTNALNETTTYAYTSLGRLARVTRPLGDFTAYAYDLAGDVTAVSQGGPSSPTYTVTYAYNALHKLTSFTDQLNHTTTYGYDADNNFTSLTDPLGHALTYGYNALNQLASVTDALGDQTTYGYDATGNITSITNPLGRVTTKTYDAQGRLLSVTAANGGVTSYGYDLMGRITSLTDPVGNTTTFAYDSAGRLSSETDPLGQVTYSYNQANELVAKTDRDGRTIDYLYNAAGQETNEEWLNSLQSIVYNATYTYDAAGELTEAQDPYSVYTYTYDADGRETSVSNAGTPGGVPTVTLSYGYDVYGNRTSLSDSLGGSISYSFDAANRLTSLGLSLNGTLTAQATLGYDNANRLTGMTRTAPSVSGDTITTSYSYDNANRLLNILHTDTTKAVTLANYTYGYDKASELTSYQDANSSLTYGYDNVGELLSASGTLNGSSYSSSYSYDLNGNRNMSGYTTGKANELTSDGTYSYTYDNEGNMLTQTNISTGSVTYFSWDYRNRLTDVKVEDKNGNVLNDEKFTYDVFNNRIGVSLNGTQQLYTVYDGANPYIDFNGSGTLTQRYLTNPLGLSEFYGQVSASGTTQWFLTDNLDSIRQVISSGGTVLDAITYDPFGSLVSQTNAVNAPRFGFTGAAVDSLTGFNGDGKRWEMPADGRFASEDAAGFGAGDANLYRYVFNAPTNATDPSGYQQQNAGENFFVNVMWGWAKPTGSGTGTSYSGGGTNYSGNAGGGGILSPTYNNGGYAPPAGSSSAGGGMASNFFGAIPNNGTSGPGLDQQVDSMLMARSRMEASGQTPPPLMAGALPAYGSDGNRNAFEAMVEGMQQTQQMCHMAIQPLTFLPGVGVLAIAGSGISNLAQGHYLGALLDFTAVGMHGNFGYSNRGGPSRFYCFPAGTLVATVAGLRPIETIKMGEKVWAYDVVASEWCPCRVLETFRRPYRGHSVIVTVAGETIESTLLHPYWVMRGEDLAERPRREHLPAVPDGATTPGRWVDAGDLRDGDELLLLDGRIAKIEAVRHSPFEAEVYNFEVEDLHCYAVGRNSVLVHNNNGDEVLQSGGNKISKRTAQHFGRSRREVGRALEELKRDNGIPNNFHGRIMSSGNYLDEAGNVLGNILDGSGPSRGITVS